MMKKAAAAVMSLAMIASAGAASSAVVLKELPTLSASAANGYEEKEIGGVQYRVYSDHAVAACILPGYHSVTILDQVDEKNVTAMDTIGFSYNYDLWYLHIKATQLTTLNTDQFRGCINLATVELSKGLEEIGQGAFQGCSLLREINIPVSVQTIKKNAFAFCSNLRSITLPWRTSYIGDYAFTHCNALKKIVFMKSTCDHISNNAFDANGNQSTTNGSGNAKVYLTNTNTSNQLYKYFKVKSYSGHYNYDTVKYKLGDVNGDSDITQTDANMVLSAYVNTLVGNSTGLTPLQTVRADVDGDGKITALDAQLITIYLNDPLAPGYNMAYFTCAYLNGVWPH